MRRQVRRGLPLLALAGALVALVCLILVSVRRTAMLVETGETRQAVEETLREVQALRPASLDDPAFRDAVEQAAEAPYVATLWLFAPDGQIVYSTGSTASVGTAEERATDEMRRVLSAMPEDALTNWQRTWLLAASAIQAEGEHNDVYRHLLREVEAPDGSSVTLIGVAYDVNPSVDGPPDLGWAVALFAALAGLGAYWLALPAWVLLDARERGERAWAWMLFVLAGNLVALIAYILARAPRREPPPDSQVRRGDVP